MFEFGPGSSNGFQEKTFLMIVVFVSLLGGDYTTSGWLSLWYGILGAATLYLAWDFNQFSYGAEAWADSEATQWSAGTIGEAPNDYIDAVSNVRERFTPSNGVLWWFFRIIYALVGAMLVLIALEKLYYGTDHLRLVFLNLMGGMAHYHLL